MGHGLFTAHCDWTIHYQDWILSQRHQGFGERLPLLCFKDWGQLTWLALRAASCKNETKPSVLPWIHREFVECLAFTEVDYLHHQFSFISMTLWDWLCCYLLSQCTFWDQTLSHSFIYLSNGWHRPTLLLWNRVDLRLEELFLISYNSILCLLCTTIIEIKHFKYKCAKISLYKTSCIFEWIMGFEQKLDTLFVPVYKPCEVTCVSLCFLCCRWL